MAAELQPPEAPITAAAAAADVAATTTTAAPPSTENLGPPLAPKRQRRPSVRLGEIGDQRGTLSYEYHGRRTKHPWRLHKDPSSKKTRPLTNLVNGGTGGGDDFHESVGPEDNNQNGDSNFDFGNRKSKARRPAAKRFRSSWVSKIDDGAQGDSREENDEGFRDFDPESDSPLKDPSPVHSVDNAVLDSWHGQRRAGRARVSESRENDAAAELDNMPETDSRYRRGGAGEEVRSWLIELGLSRYAPVFEIHEVDEEVLPMLTLEDLKDMGINAVGSRRKLYAAIQKLRKGFS